MSAKEYKAIPEPKLPERTKEERCDSCDGECCGSCGDCHECYDMPPAHGSFEHLSGGWSILGVLVGILLIVWIVAKGVEVRRMLTYPPAGIPEHAITLSASGKTVVTPDIAEVELSVLTEGATPDAVQKENSQKMNAIIDFVKANKVDAKDIKTATYSLYPRYAYDKGQSTIIGYALTQSLRVKLRTVDLVGPILEGATQHGANQVGDVRYLVDDPDALKAEARKEAFEKVSAKAHDLANLAGVHLGRIISFTESGGDVPPPIFYGKVDAAGLGGPAPAPQTEPGTQDISVTVTVTYEIR